MAWRRAAGIGMDMGKLRRIAGTAAVFTVAPAVAIVISVISEFLGYVFCDFSAWQR